MKLHNKVLLYMTTNILVLEITDYIVTSTNRNLMEVSLHQLKSDGTPLDVQSLMWANHSTYFFVSVALFIFGLLLFQSNLKQLFRRN